MPNYRTKFQNSKMFGLAAKCGLTHEDLKDYAAEVSNGRTDRTSKLYINEAQTIINRLEAVAEPKKDWSPRTVQHHRQKAGIKKIVTATHLDHLSKLARERGMSKEGLKSLCLRMIKIEKPLYSSDCTKVIEAIKAMNARDAEAKPAVENNELKEAA